MFYAAAALESLDLFLKMSASNDGVKPIANLGKRYR